MVDGAKLSGFVHVGEGATLSADVAVHQKVHIGKLAFVGPKALVANDILPFTIAVDSSSAEHHGAVHRAINKIGLERSGIDDASQHMIHKAYKAVFERGASFDGAPAKLREEPFAGNEYVAHMADFIERSQQDGRGLSISANTLRRRAAPDIAG
jgi:UDP-N-acetylglucosamine acyltransferase